MIEALTAQGAQAVTRFGVRAAPGDAFQVKRRDHLRQKGVFQSGWPIQCLDLGLHGREVKGDGGEELDSQALARTRRQAVAAAPTRRQRVARCAPRAAPVRAPGHRGDRGVIPGHPARKNFRQLVPVVLQVGIACPSPEWLHGVRLELHGHPLLQCPHPRAALLLVQESARGRRESQMLSLLVGVEHGAQGLQQRRPAPARAPRR
jgi:hypothetical protein